VVVSTDFRETRKEYRVPMSFKYSKQLSRGKKALTHPLDEGGNSPSLLG